MIARAAYAYRADPAVPAFDDRRPVFVFDGTCVLCSTGARWLMRHDPAERVRFLSAQSPLGASLYAHFGLPLDDSYLLIADGRVWTKSDGYLKLGEILGGGWRLLRVGRLVPRFLRDAAYDLVARNRYRWFGQVQQCALLTSDQRRRLLAPDAPVANRAEPGTTGA